MTTGDENLPMPDPAFTTDPPSIDVDALEAGIARDALAREHVPSIEELREFARVRAARRPERRAAERRAVRRELVEAAIIGLVIALAAVILFLWLTAPPAHAASAEENVAAALVVARAQAPAPTCGDALRIEVRDLADVAASAGYALGAKVGYYDASNCLVVIAREEAAESPASACAVLEHELRHAAGEQHVLDDPSNIMTDGPIPTPDHCRALGGPTFTPADEVADELESLLEYGRERWPNLRPSCTTAPARVRCKWGDSRLYPRTVVSTDRDGDHRFEHSSIMDGVSLRELRRLRRERAAVSREHGTGRVNSAHRRNVR
jgi:hypothetical protein